MTLDSGPFVTTTEAVRNHRDGGIDSGNIDRSEYEGPSDEGSLTVRTLPGVEFAPSNPEIPRITPQPVRLLDQHLIEAAEEAESVEVVLVLDDGKGGEIYYDPSNGLVTQINTQEV